MNENEYYNKDDFKKERENLNKTFSLFKEQLIQHVSNIKKSNLVKEKKNKTIYLLNDFYMDFYNTYVNLVNEISNPSVISDVENVLPKKRTMGFYYSENITIESAASMFSGKLFSEPDNET